MSIDLAQYGWDDFFASAKKSSSESHLAHGRVLSVHKLHYDVVLESGIVTCDILGVLQFQKDPLLQPAVGDWVLVDWHAETPVIHEILNRKNILKRQKKHDTFPKPIAANVDIAVIIQSGQDDFNIKRLERILVHVQEAQMTPMIVINKIDTLSDIERQRITTELSGISAPVYCMSAETQEGVSEFVRALGTGKTVVFIGSSGVGKSTLLNLIHGDDIQKTQSVMETGKGRHTTTARTLVKTNAGILIIDTPGTREFGMYGDDVDAITESFDTIEVFAQQCRFSDCQHETEPGCAIQTAIQDEVLDQATLNRYKELLREQSQSAKQMRQDERRVGNVKKSEPVRSIRPGKSKK